MVANALRQRILSGDIADGSTLPNQEKLLDEFRVSKPSIREALRILETEGLVTVQRGNVGGAIVHRPTAHQAAYTLALILQAQQADLDDVGNALTELEPVCTALCAQLEDRAGIVAALQQANDEADASVSDDEAFAEAMTAFHAAIIQACGNRTLILLAGAVRSVWRAHAPDGLGTGDDSESTFEARRHSVRDHRRITALIERGDGLRASELMRQHFDPALAPEGEVDGNRSIEAGHLRPAPPPPWL